MLSDCVQDAERCSDSQPDSYDLVESQQRTCRGRDVTLHHPYASDEAKRYEVVIKAPVPALQQDAIPLYQAAANAQEQKKDA